MTSRQILRKELQKLYRRSASAIHPDTIAQYEAAIDYAEQELATLMDTDEEANA